MDIHKLLPYLIRLKGQADIAVEGFSMEPTLVAGDVVTVQVGEYLPGDILIFYYKEEKLLIHRLLYVQGNRFFCKGDNAFRIEDFTREQLVGKAVLVNGEFVTPWPQWKISLSLAVGKEFRRHHYNVVQTTESKTYQLYQTLVLKRNNTKVIYQKNKECSFFLINETSMTVIDPKRNNTLLLDELGVSILDCFNEPIALDLLLGNLCQKYAVAPEEIQGDVEERLAEMVQKEVVVPV